MFLQTLFNHFKPKTYPSTVNKTVRMGISFGKRAIFASNVPQSGGEFIYQWDTVITHIKEKGYVPHACLMLGVAGGTAINSLRKLYPKMHITGIEIDPVILEIALQHSLFKPDKNVQIKIADALQWIREDKNSYELIIVDLFLGDTNVQAARQALFLTQLKTHSSKGGIVLYNSHYNQDRVGEYKAFIKRLKGVFSRVEVVFEFPKNKVLLLETK